MTTFGTVSQNRLGFSKTRSARRPPTEPQTAQHTATLSRGKAHIRVSVPSQTRCHRCHCPEFKFRPWNTSCDNTNKLKGVGTQESYHFNNNKTDSRHVRSRLLLQHSKPRQVRNALLAKPIILQAFLGKC